MANPREHIRAAQAAELRGDRAAAIAELCAAAELFRRARNLPRALQLLRHALKLDPSRDDVAEELARLEVSEEASEGAALQGDDSEARVLTLDPEEEAERQQLLEQMLREAERSDAEPEEPEEMPGWPVEEPPGERDRPVDLQDASRRALDWALRQDVDETRTPREWTVDEAERPHELGLRPVEEPPQGPQVSLEVKTLFEGEVTTLVADVEVGAVEETSAPPEPTLIERGPTRADPAIDAWCSFCCRPGAEVGELVAGPTGSFICAACVTESRGLLSLEDAVPARPRASKRKAGPVAGAVALVGRQEARALLERALEAGARRVLVIGPEGTGKTVWFQELEREELGTLVTLDTLEAGGGGTVVLVEDVDRFMFEDWTRLGALMARYPERTILMSARGHVSAPSFVLQGAAGSLPVFTTSALSQAVLDVLPLELLEQVDATIMLQMPTEAEFLEIARRRLASRGSEAAVSDEVLARFASEAARSPRGGHELNALLARVPGGSWHLPGAAKKGRAKKTGEKGTAGKGAAPRPARRGKRKGPR